MNVRLYGLLVERARNRGHVFYSKTGPGSRGASGRELEEISKAEVAAGRPMLSVLVVDKATGRPNAGFLPLAIRLGRATKSESEAAVVKRETRLVYETWEPAVDRFV